MPTLARNTAQFLLFAVKYAHFAPFDRLHKSGGGNLYKMHKCLVPIFSKMQKKVNIVLFFDTIVQDFFDLM